jgi:DNA-directed RNA polymerase subunit M/transcription elongation factor TFIIS
MTFQFQCPHCQQILEGDPSQASQACQCPTCQQQFIIPAPAPAAPAPPRAPAPFAAPPAAAPPAPAIHTAGPPTPQAEPSPPQGPASEGFKINRKGESNPFGKKPEVIVYHIPCPKCPDNRLLETPKEMLGQEAICPYCGTQLKLTEKRSIEYKQKKKEELDKKDRKAGKAWLNWAIVFVVLVVIGVAALIFGSSRG